MPDPLVPSDCDLRDFRFMPVEVERLRRSKAWLLAKRQPELGFYMMNLWMAAWHEVPAASLEDDDDVLADAAMCEPRRWKKVRETALRGWIKGNDGRLYHSVVAEKANEAWAERQAYRARTAAARAAKLQKQNSSVKASVTEHVTCDVTGTDIDDVTVLKGRDREGTGKGQGYLEETPNPAERGFSENEKVNPRAAGINPRANGTNPRAKAEAKAGEQPWEQRCHSWAKTGFWNDFWGPAPSELSCYAPPNLAAEARKLRNGFHNPRPTE